MASPRGAGTLVAVTRARALAVGTLVAASAGAVVHCGGSVRFDDAAPDASSADAAPGVILPPAADAASPAKCKPDGGEARLVDTVAFGGACHEQADCPGGSCIRLRGYDAGRDLGFCVPGLDPCSGIRCPSCKTCEFSSISGVPADIGCAFADVEYPVLARPDLLGGECASPSDCAEGEVCVDVSALDPSYTSARCARVSVKRMRARHVRAVARVHVRPRRELRSGAVPLGPSPM